MPPGHDLIGTDQRQIAFVEVARFLVVNDDHLHIQSNLNSGRQKCIGLTLIVAKAKQCPFETKAIEQRAAIRQPDMRRAATGFAGRHIGGGRIGRRRRRIDSNNGRAVISRAERKTGNIEFSSRMIGEIFTRAPTRRFASPPLRLKRGRRSVQTDRVGKGLGKTGIAKCNGPAFGLITIQQRFGRLPF